MITETIKLQHDKIYRLCPLRHNYDGPQWFLDPDTELEREAEVEERTILEHTGYTVRDDVIRGWAPYDTVISWYDSYGDRRDYLARLAPLDGRDSG